MKTLTQSPSQPLEFRQTHDTQYLIYRDDRNLGAIALKAIAKRREYPPFGRPIKATGMLEQCREATLNDLQPHPYSYSHATPDSLPPRFHIEHHPGQGYRAHFTPLTPGPGNFPLPTHYSDYFPSADLALEDHLSEYIEDLTQYQAFQTLLSLSQYLDGRAVINAFELLKEINPDDDYYLDVEAGRADF